MVVGYGSTDHAAEDAVEEEMGQMTDEEQATNKKRKGKKSGMKPGQALSFTGLEPRKWDGVDMLDMKQMLPRAIGGTLCMFVTIALVAVWCYHVIGGRLGHALKESQGLQAGSRAVGSHGRVGERHASKHLLSHSHAKKHKALHRLSHHASNMSPTHRRLLQIRSK